MINIVQYLYKNYIKIRYWTKIELQALKKALYNFSTFISRNRYKTHVGTMELETIVYFLDIQLLFGLSQVLVFYIPNHIHIVLSFLF